MPLNMSEGEFRRSKWNTGRRSRGTTLPAQPRKAETTTQVRAVGIQGVKRLILQIGETDERIAWMAREVFPEPIDCRLQVSIVIHSSRYRTLCLGWIDEHIFSVLDGIIWKCETQVWNLNVQRGSGMPEGQLDITIQEYRP